MKVLHVVPGLNESSGPTQAVRSLAHAQVRLGCDVTIATISGRGTDHDRAKFVGLNVKAFPTTILKHWAYSPPLAKWLGDNVSGFDHVHIHSLWLYPSFATSRACIRAGVPYWIRPAGSLEIWSLRHRSLRKLIYYQAIERRALEKSAAIHAVSQKELSSIQQLGLRANIVCIPNGTERAEVASLEPKDAIRRSLNLPVGEKIVLYVGRIHPVKGLDVLAEAMKALESQVSCVRLVVVGPVSGLYANQIIEKFEGLGFERKVLFFGELKGQKKNDMFLAADLLVLPSRSENFGMVVLEALAHGLPVVTTKHTPWAEIERIGAGYWCDLDPEKLSMAMKQILESPDLAASMGIQGQKLVAEKYSWDSIAKEMLVAYRETRHQSAKTGAR